ncbi:type I restriction enzyme HsdR N-terminal domain-containing protein [Bacillus cereus group sp. BceL101]|uniref:type I restriction enzyme HsdR N-terminal domain-containing protein n=2 Tax=Bacillus TaxID=1386 RepID=UPI0022E0D955|nr:type I restriction enzyme HsdR N-terminal domain-containing protein [Bacillus cereus]MDF9630516.1 type I restriction enzyme HsdR N-terminal domain-containing protein [Bacillus cereus]MDF9635145.1 type I restriction enzyme HsdR N-terminal domain-containing protein [Bacillus cereus]MDG1583609.1 type I restriction enzyme HsdR N-terminal domain-containing protein [Bacillus cereus]MDZ4503325.1 type I restriction enzyme HsdR N-terminal domain-containing protein [Bacillus cereus]WKT33003.1 type I 
MYQKFLENWKSQDFLDWNESDIREEFIAPLLKELGYGKGTVNNVVREKSLKLSTPYHRVGRSRVQIDYIPTIRLKSFWIIEAKPGNKKDMDMGDLLQAHLYAVHPEVQARFIVLTNGWEIRVYDALNVTSWEDYIVLCNKDSELIDLKKLFQILNSKDMLRFLRTQIMHQIENSFAVELDQSELNHFFTSLNRKEYDLKKQIEDNARDFQRKAWRKEEDKYQSELQKLPIDSLLVRMDIPTDSTIQTSNEYVRRVLAADEVERVILIDKLAMRWRGRSHNVFKIHSLRVLLELLKKNVEIKPSFYQHGLIASVNELALSNIYYGAENELVNALCHLDNVCIRVGYKAALKFSMDQLILRVEEDRKTLSIEEKLTRDTSVSANMIPIISISYESLWRIFSGGLTHNIWNAIWFIQTIERSIDRLPEIEYPKGDGDLLFFKHYGNGFDILMMGTWDFLNIYKNVILENSEIASDIKAFVNLEHEKVMKKIPQPKSASPEWRMDEEFLKDVFERP